VVLWLVLRRNSFELIYGIAQPVRTRHYTSPGQAPGPGQLVFEQSRPKPFAGGGQPGMDSVRWVGFSRMGWQALYIVQTVRQENYTKNGRWSRNTT